MAHKPRTEMIAETRAKLIDAARQAFGTVGYAGASMDDFTSAAGLTRGALYHHFGDKKGLLQAVIATIDAEMSQRLCAISASIWSTTASNRPRLSPKWWYSAPRVRPASAVKPSIEASA